MGGWHGGKPGTGGASFPRKNTKYKIQNAHSTVCLVPCLRNRLLARQPRGVEVSGNLIHHLGLYTKQSCGIFLALTCQNTIVGNILFHAPRALLNLNDEFGGDTLVSKNLFFGSMLETKDQ